MATTRTSNSANCFQISFFKVEWKLSESRPQQFLPLEFLQDEYFYKQSISGIFLTRLSHNISNTELLGNSLSMLLSLWFRHWKTLICDEIYFCRLLWLEHNGANAETLSSRKYCCWLFINKWTFDNILQKKRIIWDDRPRLQQSFTAPIELRNQTGQINELFCLINSPVRCAHFHHHYFFQNWKISSFRVIWEPEVHLTVMKGFRIWASYLHTIFDPVKNSKWRLGLSIVILSGEVTNGSPGRTFARWRRIGSQKIGTCQLIREKIAALSSRSRRLLMQISWERA